MALKRGPVRIPDPAPRPRIRKAPVDPDDVFLPPRPVLDAGLAKFKEMAALHWPQKEGSYSFDINNTAQLMITLGLVYNAMKGADRAH